MKSWPERLRALEAKLAKTPDEFASMLGITPRTLGEFTRPEGRDPSAPIQRLVEMFETGLGIGLPVFEKEASQKLNLVIIHGDFADKDGRDLVTVIDDMHKAAGESGNIEFHYITVNPERDMPKALTILQNKRVTPHFFMHESHLPNSEQTRCSYFSTTATWLASCATGKDLGHITLAADVKAYWPVAKELKALTETDVSFIRGADVDGKDVELSHEQLKAMEALGIGVISPASRHFGRIRSLVDVSKNSGYGFLEYVKQANDNKWTGLVSNAVFFSWNHMRKIEGTKIPETPIAELKVGDIVGFAIGMNNKGACATDVTLIERTSEESSKESEILELIKDAIRICANEKGWALLSNIGSRLSVQQPDYKEAFRIADLIKKHTEIFDYSMDSAESGFSAASARLK